MSSHRPPSTLKYKYKEFFSIEIRYLSFFSINLSCEWDMEQLRGRSKFYWLQFTTLPPVSPASHVSKMFMHLHESFCTSASLKWSQVIALNALRTVWCWSLSESWQSGKRQTKRPWLKWQSRCKHKHIVNEKYCFKTARLCQGALRW